MKKFCSILLALTAVILLLAGCDSVADEKKIQEDLTTLTRFEVLSEGEQIKSLEIEKRQTEKDRKLDVVWCNLTTEDAECRYEKSAVLSYTLYDEGGWILDNVSVSDQREWTISPLVGIRDSDVEVSLNDVSVSIGGDQWHVTEENVKNFSIEDHTTDLEQKTDTVTIAFTIEDQVEEAAGKLTLHYVFDDQWELESTSGEDSFVVSTISGKELEVTQNDLIDALSDQEYKYGKEEKESGGLVWLISDGQPVPINQNEVENFKIEKEETSSRGTQKEYICHFDLAKKHVKFEVDATIPYAYSSSNGWVKQNPDISMKCVSADISGEWTGSYRGTENGTSTLNLSAEAESGKYTGTYSYRSVKGNNVGSYRVEGTIDLGTLYISLIAGDWIEEPEQWYYQDDKEDIVGRLFVDTNLISGSAQDGHGFKVGQ